VMAAGHDHAVLETMCDRAVLMDGGAIGADGHFREVVDNYALAR
jgi:ABC-type polysaccharide/polyol phosphate transport system ATPase subunit